MSVSQLLGSRKKRMSADSRSSRWVVLRPRTYDKLIKGVPQVAFQEILSLNSRSIGMRWISR